MRGVKQIYEAAKLTIATEGSAMHLKNEYKVLVFDEIHELTDEF